jgi:hypothetical protein
MKGFMKSALTAACLAGGLCSMGCYGGEKYRDCVDPCQIERYSAAARQEVITAFAPQVLNGHILDQTIWNYHFEPGTDKLNPSGLDKLDQIVRRRPQPDARVFLATARDVTYNAEKSDEYADTRRELDAKRSVAIQKYLAAQTAGRPVPFDVLIHDPADPGIPGAAVINAILSQRGVYSGRIGTVGGGGAASTSITSSGVTVSSQPGQTGTPGSMSPGAYPPR